MPQKVDNGSNKSDPEKSEQDKGNLENTRRKSNTGRGLGRGGGKGLRDGSGGGRGRGGGGHGGGRNPVG
jgi:hypothetical protein